MSAQQEIDQPQLSERERNILKALIREYVETGKPVGSRRLTKLDPEGMSAATIRNVMADLEESGFVTQPHTSAGRVPTAEGYRFYVDSLVEAGPLSRRDLEQIKRGLADETDPAELMNKTSQILSSFSSNLGFVVAPPLSSVVIKRLEFIKIASRRILVILVSKNGLVQHRVIQTEDDWEQTELDQAGRYLITHFSGKTLTETRQELLAMMSEEKALYDRMLKNVIVLGSAGLMAHEQQEQSDSEVYFGGMSGIIEKPEMADVKRMMGLFEAFEEKSRLVQIISECLKKDRTGPAVTIGLEDSLPQLHDWTIISSPYRADSRVMGGLGVIGPSRMEYEKAISLVDYVAKLVGKLISQQNF
ncbi:MAG TPA: heat-inducible transcriptional repressor HrcA [Acidobacteriota bacterium]|nr:heat-inducible transcriptional repressor HrcA [Acidobacteriota bacterium]